MRHTLLASLLMILIHITSLAEEITTGNLLPNAGNSASSAQSVDNTIPQIGNDFNQFTSSNATDFTSEVEVTGTGSISYSSSLLNITTGDDTTTQQKLNNGITLQGNTIVQNCEWSQSSYACGNRGAGQDSYSTKIQILNEGGSVISETNQIRNNDAGYGSTAHKYTDTLIYNDTGAYTFNWQWTGIDGESNPRSLGGPNLLGANLFMTYDNSILDESVTEELTTITKSLTNTLREVIIEEEVKIEAAPITTMPTTPVATSAPVTKSAPVMTATPVATKQTTSPPPTKTPVQTKTAPTTAAKSSTTTNGNKNAKLTTSTTSSGSTKNTKNESKKEVSKESNSKTTTTTNTKKESSSKQETVQSKKTTGESKTASSEVQSQSGSIDLQMAKVDSDIKDIGKNLEVKNIIKLKAMVNNDMIAAYNVPFYIGKDIYLDQLNIFDEPIYQDVNLGQYILNDPVVQSKIKLIEIQDQKQKLLNEIEVLKNG
tara:strand:+ start:344 stop:1801 length:1458 start_codon:yes stop_codon:yes gene_type:complete